jgi:hypothetical protein
MHAWFVSFSPAGRPPLLLEYLKLAKLEGGLLISSLQLAPSRVRWRTRGGDTNEHDRAGSKLKSDGDGLLLIGSTSTMRSGHACMLPARRPVRKSSTLISPVKDRLPGIIVRRDDRDTAETTDRDTTLALAPSGAVSPLLGLWTDGFQIQQTPRSAGVLPGLFSGSGRACRAVHTNHDGRRQRDRRASRRRCWRYRGGEGIPGFRPSARRRGVRDHDGGRWSVHASIYQSGV